MEKKKSADLDHKQLSQTRKKLPISQPHQKFWVQLKDPYHEYQLPIVGGNLSAGSSAAAFQTFPISCTFQLTFHRNGVTSYDQIFQMFHGCFKLLGAKISSHSDQWFRRYSHFRIQKTHTVSSFHFSENILHDVQRSMHPHENYSKL